MQGYSERLEDGVTVYTLQNLNASTLIGVRDAITHAVDHSPNVFRAIILTGVEANTPGIFAQVLSNVEVFGKIPWQSPGYRIGIVIGGNAGELFSQAEILWDKGGFMNRLLAAGLFALNLADGALNFESLMNNAISKNDDIKVEKNFALAKQWVSE